MKGSNREKKGLVESNLFYTVRFSKKALSCHGFFPHGSISNQPNSKLNSLNQSDGLAFQVNVSLWYKNGVGGIRALIFTVKFSPDIIKRYKPYSYSISKTVLLVWYIIAVTWKGTSNGVNTRVVIYFVIKVLKVHINQIILL